MGTLSIVSTTAAHIAPLSEGMREADKREVMASGGHTPIEALEASVSIDLYSETALDGADPFCIFGVYSGMDSGIGVPWLLATDAIGKHTTALLRTSRRYVDKWRRDHDLLVNYVDARNTTSIRWLAWLGFDILDPEPFGIEGRPFHRFELRQRSAG